MAGPTNTYGWSRGVRQGGIRSTIPLTMKLSAATPPTPHTIATCGEALRGVAVAQEDKPW